MKPWISGLSFVAVMISLASAFAQSSPDTLGMDSTKGTIHMLPLTIKGTITGSYQLDAQTDFQGDLASFHFYGKDSNATRERKIALSEIMGGNTASNLVRQSPFGDLIWLQADPAFTAKDGGILNITYVSSWGLFTGLRKSVFKVNVLRSGSKWIAEDPSHMDAKGQPAVIRSAIVNIQGTFKGSVSFTAVY